MRKLLLAGIVAGYVLVGTAVPTLANNDPKVPGDDCSDNNPGESTGAMGQANFNGGAGCAP